MCRGSKAEDDSAQRPQAHPPDRSAPCHRHRRRVLQQSERGLRVRRCVPPHEQPFDPQSAEHPPFLLRPVHAHDGPGERRSAPGPPDHLCSQPCDLGPAAVELSRRQHGAPPRRRIARLPHRSGPLVAGPRARTGGGGPVLRAGAAQQPDTGLHVGALRLAVHDALPGSLLVRAAPAAVAGSAAACAGAAHQGDRRHVAGGDRRLRLPVPRPCPLPDGARLRARLAARRPARPGAGGPRPRVPPLPAPPTPAVGKRDVSPVVHHALALVHERVVGAAVLRAAVPLAGRAVDRPRFPLRVQLLSGSRVAGSVRDRGVDRGRPAQRRPPAPGRVCHRVVLHHPGAGVVLRAACRGGQRSSAVHRVVTRRPPGCGNVSSRLSSWPAWCSVRSRFRSRVTGTGSGRIPCGCGRMPQRKAPATDARG